MNTVPPPSRRASSVLIATRNSTPPNTVLVADGLLPSAKRRSYAECYAHYLPVAMRIPASERVVCKCNPRVALANVRVGLDAVCADHALVTLHMPTVNVAELAECADIARAVVHATSRLRRKGAPRTAIRECIRAITTPRQEAIALLLMLVRRGKLKDDADVIRALGTRPGVPAMAEDAATAAGIFKARAKEIAGMHPFSAAETTTLLTSAEWLVEQLKPAGVDAPRPAKVDSSAQERNALWTLLVRRHEVLRRVGMYFHGANVDDVVPPLQSRSVARDAREEDDGGDDGGGSDDEGGNDDGNTP